MTGVCLARYCLAQTFRSGGKMDERASSQQLVVSEEEFGVILEMRELSDPNLELLLLTMRNLRRTQKK